MLPIINLNLTELCYVGTHLLGDGQQKIAAHTHAHHFEELRRAVTTADENLDRFLSKAILRGISAKPVKTKLVFFYAPHNDFTFISVSSHDLKAKCDWLYNITAHYESGREFLRDNARPFMYWDGGNLHRIYELPEDYESGAKYITDFGALSGLLIGEADDYDYRRIRDNKVENWDYSVVPDQHEEIITDKVQRKATAQRTLFSQDEDNNTGKGSILLHDFYK